MAQTTTTSGLFSINWKDAGKGFIVAVITAAVATIGQSLQAGAIPTLLQLKTAGIVGLAAGFSYLVKNFFTVAQVVAPADAPSDPNKPTTDKPGGN